MADETATDASYIGYMKSWTKSAIRNYYLDPVILFLEVGPRDTGRAAIAPAGYYVEPHCDPDCCQAFGGVRRLELGPFLTADEARRWSVTNLATIN